MTDELIGVLQDTPPLGSPPASEAEYSVTSAWEKVQLHIQALLRLKDNWDGEGAPGVNQDLVRSTLHLVSQLMVDDEQAPQDVYPLPDGNIILEWRRAAGRIDRIEIEAVGRGQQMSTYPNAPAEFYPVEWVKVGTPARAVQMANDHAVFQSEAFDVVDYADEVEFHLAA